MAKPKVEVVVVEPHVVTKPYNGTVNTLVSDKLPSLND